MRDQSRAVVNVNRQQAQPPDLGSKIFWLVPGLTHCGLLVMTRHIVPFDTVSVEIIEDAQTGLQWVISHYQIQYCVQ